MFSKSADKRGAEQVAKDTSEFEAMVGRRSQQESGDGADESSRIAREKEGLRKLVFETPRQNPAGRARPKAPQREPENRRRRSVESIGADKKPLRDRSSASARAKSTESVEPGRTESKAADRRVKSDTENRDLEGLVDRFVRAPAAIYFMAAALVATAGLGAALLARSDRFDSPASQRRAENAGPKIEPEPWSGEQISAPGEAFAESDGVALPKTALEPSVDPGESRSDVSSSAVATMTVPAEPVVEAPPQSAAPPDQAARPSASISVGGAPFFDDRTPTFIGAIDLAPPPSISSAPRAEVKRASEAESSRSGKESRLTPQPEKSAPPRSLSAGRASSANSEKKKEPPVAVRQERPVESHDDSRAERPPEPAPPPPREADEYRRRSLQEAFEFVAGILTNRQRQVEEPR